jgi:hypothetical protein
VCRFIYIGLYAFQLLQHQNHLQHSFAKEMIKQAGTELCQARAQVDLPAEVEFPLPVGFQNLLKKVSFDIAGYFNLFWSSYIFSKLKKISALLKYNYIQYKVGFALTCSFQLVGSSSIEVVLYGGRLSLSKNFHNCIELYWSKT